MILDKLSKKITCDICNKECPKRKFVGFRKYVHNKNNKIIKNICKDHPFITELNKGIEYISDDKTYVILSKKVKCDFCNKELNGEKYPGYVLVTYGKGDVHTIEYLCKNHIYKTIRFPQEKVMKEGGLAWAKKYDIDNMYHRKKTQKVLWYGKDAPYPLDYDPEDPNRPNCTMAYEIDVNEFDDNVKEFLLKPDVQIVGKTRLF